MVFEGHNFGDLRNWPNLHRFLHLARIS